MKAAIDFGFSFGLRGFGDSKADEICGSGGDADRHGEEE